MKKNTKNENGAAGIIKQTAEGESSVPPTDAKDDGGAKTGSRNKPTTEVPPESEQTEQYLSLLAHVSEEIQRSHAAGEAAAQDVRWNAFRCGLYLHLGKNVVVCEDFGKWCDEEGFAFTKMTRSRYMRLLARLCKEGNTNPELLFSVESDDDRIPRTFVADEARLKEMISKICGQRTLTQLYKDWGILKAERSPGVKTQRPTKPGVSGKAAFKHLVESLDKAQARISELSKLERTKLVAKLETLLEKLKQDSAEAKQDNTENNGESNTPQDLSGGTAATSSPGDAAEKLPLAA
jgi:hypothetical protein